MRSLMLLACLWTGSALAEVAEEDWPGFVGHEVRLVNPAGKQIEGTIVSVAGDEVVIRRSRDDREFTIAKADVESCEKLRPTAKKVVEGAKKQTREAVGEVTTELDEEADRAVDKTGEVLENLGERIQGEDQDEVELAAPAEQSAEQPAAAEQPAEVADDAAAPQLDKPVVVEGRSYADGLTAGRLEAGEERMLKPFGVGAGATCATMTLCVGGCGLLGGCVGVVGGAAAPIYYGGVRPYTLKDELAAQVVDEPTEYAAGYVRGYTDELQRKETVMATAGSVVGLVAGAVLGTGVYLAIGAAREDTTP